MLNRKNQRINLMVVAWMLALLVSQAWAVTNGSDANERYISAYRAYQEAVARNLPQTQLQSFLSEYIEAKAAFNAVVKPTTGSANGTSQAPAADQGALAPAGEGVSVGAPISVTETNGAPDVKGRFLPEPPEPKTAADDPALPTQLRGIFKDLWNSANRKTPDSAIDRLEKFIANNPGSKNLGVARYELAKAYEWLKKDVSKAQATLKVLAADTKAGSYSKLAADRLKFLDSSKQHDQWKKVLQAKSDTKDAAYKSYRDTSFFAIPVKIFRYGSYFAKLISFQGAQRDYKKFQLWFEETGSPFVPPVDVAFNLFQPASGSEDSAGTIRLIYSNNEAWYTRWKLLNEAKRSIDVQYFIVDDDIFGMSLAGLFLRKAKEGVKIRFMMDARGTKGFTRKLQGQDFMQELAAYPNVEIKVFNPVHQNFLTLFMDLRRIMSSNHDKIVVVDDEYAIVGGRNISKDYFVEPEDHPSAYRDCDVLIHSAEVAKSLDTAFTEEFAGLKQLSIARDALGNIDVMSKELETAWNAMDSWIRTGKPFAPKSPDARTAKALKTYNAELALYKHMVGYQQFNYLANAMEGPVKIIDKHSMSGPRNDITDQIVRFMDGARREIIIQNPYVVLTERAENALKRAAKRGVPIYIHTNSPVSTDSAATQAMFYRDWKEILRDIPTCRIFTYYGTRKLHAKNFVFDGQIGVVGTYNMDYLSEEVNSEVVAAINCRDFAQQLRNDIVTDLSNSKEYLIKRLPNGDVEAVFGPDNLEGKNFWIIKTLAFLGWLRPVI